MELLHRGECQLPVAAFDDERSGSASTRIKLFGRTIKGRTNGNRSRRRVAHGHETIRGHLSQPLENARKIRGHDLSPARHGFQDRDRPTVARGYG